MIKIFEDTLKRTEQYKDSVTTKHTFKDIVIDKYDDYVNVEVINSDTVSAGVEWSKKGRTCILNMASYKRPGGGVERGARAQEECLFRCSNLFHVISKDFYPLKENEALYTKDAVFIKDKNYNLIQPVKLDVITIAAVNLNIGGSHDLKFQNTKEYESLMMNKIRLMLSLPSKNNCENIILGAWGCGVFKNNPSVVANFFRRVIEENSYGFKNIIFAIINDHNSVDDNYTKFLNVL